MKLGLKIEITSQGAGTAAKTYNSTPALEKYASASRSIIKDAFPAREDLRQKGLDANLSLDESERTVTFLRFLGPQGYLICIFQARPENSGRPYDGAAAWIHVPASVVLSGSETEKLIDVVEAALSSERGIDYARLEAIFSKDYNEKNQMPAIASIGSNGEFSAVRYYGNGTDYQLSKLLGNGIAQPEYGKYKAIFLLRKSENIEFSGQEITSTLVPTCVIEPPTQNSGFAPFFENGSPFSLPIEIPVGTTVKILWKRQGYKDIVKAVRANNFNVETSNCVFGFSNTDILFAVYRQWFRVHSKNKELRQCRIMVDNQQLIDVVYLPESQKATGTRVRITADGFMPFQKDMLLTSNIDIPMKRVMYHYEFAIPMYDGKDRISDGVVVLETSHKIKNCPIKGYSLKDEDYVKEGKNNIIHHEEGGILETMKYFAYGFLTCVCIILAIFLYNDGIKSKSGFPWFEFVMHSDGGDTTSDGVQGVDNIGNSGVIAEDPIDYRSFEYAKSYLNRNDTWCKDSIAKYPSLNGLFEAFNEYKFDEIVNVWADSLKDVSKFSKIVNAADLAMNGKWNPRLGDHNPDYNKDNDNMINLTNYANWISADQTPKPEVAKSQSAAKPQKQAAKSADPANNNNKKKRGAV